MAALFGKYQQLVHCKPSTNLKALMLLVNRCYKRPFASAPTAINLKSPPIPTVNDPPIVRRPGDIVDVATIVRNWWAFPAVGFNSILEVPVHKFEIFDGESDTKDVVVFPNDIFGVPLRPDILYLCYRFHRRALAGYSERMQLFKWEWPGSSRKYRSQIRSGKSRMGWRKAPGKYYGVKAIPLRPFDARIKIPRRVLWKGLIVMLSAKYAQNQIVVVDHFILRSHKTKHTVKHLRRLLGSNCSSALLVHEGENDMNECFRWAVSHITAVRRENVEGLNVYNLLKFRLLVITELALQKLMMKIYDYPKESGWLPKNATPDGLPAPKPTPVAGWNREWNERKWKEKNAVFDKEMLRKYTAEWKWTSSLKGALKVPRKDPLKRFKLLDIPDGKPERSLNFIEGLYEDDEPLEETIEDLNIADYYEENPEHFPC